MGFNIDSIFIEVNKNFKLNLDRIYIESIFHWHTVIIHSIKYMSREKNTCNRLFFLYNGRRQEELENGLL